MRSTGRQVEAVGTYLPGDFVQEVARQTYAVDHLPLRFDSPWPVSPRHAAFWSRTADFASAARDSGALEQDLVRAAVLRNLAVGLLECFRLAGDREARTASAAAAQRLFRAATRFLEDLASLPITAGDAAQAVGVPAPELDRIFGHLAGTTVSGYLRRVRLSAAHEELLRGGPAPDLRSLALRWGFATLDSFSRAYRREYGVPPRRTVRP
jgi:AraC-like DNA-binding protein